VKGEAENGEPERPIRGLSGSEKTGAFCVIQEAPEIGRREKTPRGLKKVKYPKG
jgi:hypothetical protein